MGSPVTHAHSKDVDKDSLADDAIGVRDARGAQTVTDQLPSGRWPSMDGTVPLLDEEETPSSQVCSENYPLPNYDPLVVRAEIESHAKYAAIRYIAEPLAKVREEFDDYASSLAHTSWLLCVLMLFLIFVNLDQDVKTWYEGALVPFVQAKLTLDKSVDGYWRVQGMISGFVLFVAAARIAWSWYQYNVKKDTILSEAKRDLALHGGSLQSQLRILSERVSGVTSSAGRDAVRALLEKWREGEAFLVAGSDETEQFCRQLTMKLADRTNFSVILFIFWTALSASLIMFAVDDLPTAPLKEIAVVLFALFLTNVVRNGLYLNEKAKELSANLIASADAIGSDGTHLDLLGLAERRREILCADPSAYIIAAHEHLISHHEAILEQDRNLSADPTNPTNLATPNGAIWSDVNAVTGQMDTGEAFPGKAHPGTAANTAKIARDLGFSLENRALR